MNAYVPGGDQPREEASIKVIHAPDRRTARALTVMLVTIGVLTAAVLFQSQQNGQMVAAADERARLAVEQNERLQASVDQLIRQRQSDAERLDRLQMFIAQVLANSQDPVLRESVREQVEAGNASPQALDEPTVPPAPPTPSSTRMPAPARTAQPAPPSRPAPQPQPTEEPGPLSGPVDAVCDVLLGLC